jgi:hypothetical protein
LKLWRGRNNGQIDNRNRNPRNGCADQCHGREPAPLPAFCLSNLTVTPRAAGGVRKRFQAEKERFGRQGGRVATCLTVAPPAAAEHSSHTTRLPPVMSVAWTSAPSDSSSDLIPATARFSACTRHAEKSLH